jgi:toxin ParE1/3/4
MKLVWTRTARFDLKEISDYYSKLNPRAATGLIDAIISAAMQLEDFPELGRHSEVGKVRLWQVPGRPYLLPYRIVGNDVEILAVFDERQKRPDERA